MNSFYSQHGEDFLLDKIFRGKKCGYFVEIGCLDGIEFSNTYHFEKKGWKGCCIEAHKDFISSLRKNRPNSSVVHCAVGEENRDNVTFYANKVGSLSTLDKGEEERWKKNYTKDFHGFEEQQVSMRTMTKVFDDLALTTIDFISLDIEGYEVKALSGLDFSKYRPRVFVIEYKDEIHKHQLDVILFKQQYYFLSQVGCNLFYSLDYADKKVIDEDYGYVPLIQIDQNGSEIISRVKLAKPTRRSRIKSFIRNLGFGKIWDSFRHGK